MNKPARPLVRYHGGKWKLAPWILSHFPAHKTYVEAFGGGGSVLIRKDRAYAEVYNDLDGEIVNLFKVARDHGEQLAQLCELTPFARAEFELSYAPSDDPIEQARRTLARSFMGFGSAGASGQSTGFRANTTRAWSTPAGNWHAYPEALRVIIERLRGVVIENRDALQCMKSHDGPGVLHYVDPPYVQETRHFRHRSQSYRFELTDAQHQDVASCLKDLQGHVILSGYRCELYDDTFKDWQRVDRAAMADGAKHRVESLWLSPSITATRLQEIAA